MEIYQTIFHIPQIINLYSKYLHPSDNLKASLLLSICLHD